MEVILCRHSTTAGNQKKQYIGITDQPLCPEGEQLARRCTPDMEVETIYCSPLRRAVATGRILYPRARVVLVPALREMDFGLFEQKSYLDLGQDPQYQQWLDSGCQDPCPGGESIAQFARRVCQGFEQIVEQAAAQGQERVVLVAHSEERVEGVLPGTVRPVAALVLEDPIRPDARETLAFFTREDVQLKIISGDNPVTVSSIARQAGLPHSDSYIDASTLADEEAMRQAAERYTIFGRVSPQQKRQLVHALQDEGHTVAMTGDGVNDVLALKDADCSIAMASGSDAARQISQLVLLDSNFSSLPSVVMEGRRVINNITRTAVLFLVKTILSFLLSFMALAFSMPYPFIPIQLSLISMVVEGIPSFFLTFEPNRDRIKGRFLSTVLRQAFPCAFIIVLNIILVDQIGPLLGLAALDLATLNVYLTAFIWLYLLLRVCMPLNKLRAALFGTMVALFGVAAYLFRDLLQIGTLTLRSLPLFLILAAASLVLYSLVAWAIGRAAAVVRAWKAGRQKNAPNSRRRGHGA